MMASIKNMKERPLYCTWVFLVLVACLLPQPSSALFGYCNKCQNWYNEEKTDTAWMDEVNDMFPCPCSVTFDHTSLTPNDQPSANWETDAACGKYWLRLCWLYHPGARGCLRSVGTTPSGARQQCCYAKDGNLITPGKRGAGTPDRSVEDHNDVDVKPYNWCCLSCLKKNSCDRYLEVRRGSDTHCL